MGLSSHVSAARANQVHLQLRLHRRALLRHPHPLRDYCHPHHRHAGGSVGQGNGQSRGAPPYLSLTFLSPSFLFLRQVHVKRQPDQADKLHVRYMHAFLLMCVASQTLPAYSFTRSHHIRRNPFCCEVRAMRHVADTAHGLRKACASLSPTSVALRKTLCVFYVLFPGPT